MTKCRRQMPSEIFSKYIGIFECSVFGVVSILFAVAPMYNDIANAYFSAEFVFRFLASFIILFVSYAVLCFLFSKVKCRVKSKAVFANKQLDVTRKPKSVILVACFMFALWLPYGLALYPGVVFFDTSFQLGQFFGTPNWDIFPMYEDASYTDHHPLFDTLLFGLFVKLGSVFFSANIGMFFYLLIQAVLTAVAFSYAIAYMRSKLNVSRNACFAAIAFLALCPVIPVFVFSMTKDSLFSWLYIIFLVHVIEIVRTRGEVFSCFGKMISIIIVAILLGLTKKTGVYVVLLAFLFLCFFVKRQRLRLALSAFAPLLVTALLLPMLVFPFLNVSPGSKVEMLGFFYQQTARYVVDYPNDVTLDEKEAISRVLDYDHLAERYAPGITNTIKNVGTGVNLWPSFSEIVDYFLVYVSQGLRHPDAYFNAVASLEAGWFDWTETMILPTASGMSLATQNGEPEIYRPAAVQEVTDKLSVCLGWIEKLPVLNLPLKMPLYAVVIPVFVSLYLRKTKSVLLPAMIPVWVSFLLLMVSPVSIAENVEAQRYLLPFIYSTPLLLMLCLCSRDGESAVEKT